MSVSVSVVEATNPEALTTSATNLGGKVAQLNSTIEAQRNAVRDLKGGWQGTAADAALARAERDLAKQTGFRDRLQQAQRALQTGGTYLGQAKGALVGIVNTLRAQGWQVSDDGVATPPPTLPPVLKNTAQAWTAAVQRLLTLFGEIDKQTAGSLPKFSPLSTDEPQFVGGDKKEDKKPDEVGAEDSEALQNGELTPEQRQRLIENTTLSPDQQTALNNGTLTLPPEQMSYLHGYSRAFGDKTPAEIKAIMDNAGPDGGRVADVFQLASNPNIKTGLPGTQPPSTSAPSNGGKYALPDGIHKVLDGPALTQPYTEGVFQDGRWVVPPEPTGPLQPTQGLNDLADIIQRGNHDLQMGTALDSGLMTKSQEMLAQSNQSPIPQAPGPGSDPMQTDLPRWYHENVDPTLQNMFNAVNKDDMVIHDAVTGHGAGEFLDNLTRHQWQDNGLAAGGLFDWVGETAANDPTGRAAETAHALAEYTSSPSSQLLNLPGADSQSLGQVNPELTRDWSRAFAPYLDDMVGYDVGGNNAKFDPLNGPEEQPLKTRTLMSVMYSDHQASEIMFNQAGANIEKYIEMAATSITDQEPTRDNSAMRAAGKLQSALDLGSFDESYDRLRNAQQAVQDSYTRRSDLYDIASGAVTDDPRLVPGQILSTYLKDVIIGPPPPENAITPTASPRNDFPVQVKLAEALIDHNIGNPEIRSWLQEQLGANGRFNVPSSDDDQDAYNLFYNKISSYITDVSGADKLMNTYWETYSSAYLNAPPHTGGN
jgi:uncharacterized protein YukE